MSDPLQQVVMLRAVTRVRAPIRALPLPIAIPCMTRTCTVALSTAASAPANSPPILTEHKGDGVLQITFNRPGQLNAMTEDMGALFQQTISSINTTGRVGDASSPMVRAVVLTGAGKAFSAGGDLNYLLARCADTPRNNIGMMMKFYNLFLCLRKLPVPIIAAINGPAVGAGMCVAAACDVTIASPTANMGFNFTALGLHPGMGITHRLPQLVAPHIAAQLLATGELFLGAKGKEYGLITHLDEKPLERAIDMARVMARNPPVGVETLTRFKHSDDDIGTLRKAQDAGLEQALYHEAMAQAECYSTSELRDRINAIKEKTKAKQS